MRKKELSNKNDFMFQLTKEEFKNLRSQFVTSSWGGRRYLPYVFTEQGVAMLSSVLNSDRAILVNIGIMRVKLGLGLVPMGIEQFDNVNISKYNEFKFKKLNLSSKL